jgi:hypothetical protein
MQNVVQLVKKLPVLLEPRRFVPVFTKTRHWSIT